MIVAGVDISTFQDAERLEGEDAEDTALLGGMYAQAKRYVRSFDWAQDISQAYFADGVGGIAAAFLFVFSKPVAGSDEALWVVVGDLPSAYFVTDQAPTADDAFKIYCNLIEEWADAVIGGQLDAAVFPVEAEPTVSNAADLLRRIAFLRESIISQR